jgi:benzaldehyde dehydrogenase (NAD)
MLPGGAEAGGALVEDPRVRIVSFTGSTAAGRKVGETAARHLKRVHLELGGNSALVVLDDADLEPTISAAAFGSFIHQGQVCMTTGRHIVHESLADEYVSRLADKASHLPVGTRRPTRSRSGRSSTRASGTACTSS